MRMATVTVGSDTCELLVLSRAHFFELCGTDRAIDDMVLEHLLEVERFRQRANSNLLRQYDDGGSGGRSSVRPQGGGSHGRAGEMTLEVNDNESMEQGSPTIRPAPPRGPPPNQRGSGRG